MHIDFLTKVTLSLFYCCEQVLIFMNIWIIGKNLIKRHYLKKKKKDFYSHLNMEDITDAHAKRVCKDFEIKN